MSIRFRRIFHNVQGSLWFIPCLIVLGLIVLAFVMVWLDSMIGYENERGIQFFFSAGPEGTRDMLTTIASSMLTVASVAFSFTIVVFSFASSQYASRTLHSFMDDNTNQAVLGTLLGSFVYCLLILRTVRLESGNEFVPLLSASVALLLAIIDLVLFILFIHHVAEAIQAYHIIHRVGKATSKSIEDFFPKQLGSSTGISEEDAEAMVTGIATRSVLSDGDGYLQAIDTDYMLALATRHDLLIIQCKGVGKFVIKDELVALIGPTGRITDEICKEIRACFLLGRHRSIYQDPQYGILLLADIAIKALSPAINDPNTATMSLNEISRVLRQIARKELPRHLLLDKEGKPRIVADVPTFERLVAQGFDQIRRYGMADAIIPAKLLDVITEIAEVVDLESEKIILREHGIAVVSDATGAIHNERDRAQINAKIMSASHALGIPEGMIKLL